MIKIKKDESNTLVAAGAVALILTTAMPVGAQAQNSEDKTPKVVGLEEVFVTARKRDENLQETPIAMTAITADDLRNKAIDSPQALMLHTPGLEIRTAGLQRNNLQFFIRGQGSTFGSSPGVITYFSDAPVGNSPKVSIGNNGQFFDLESVQVLKGPQGTLFGKNTTGGAVLFTPQSPGNEFGGFLQAKAGNYGMQEYTGAVTVPVVDGILSTRLAGNIIRRDGFTKSLTTGQELDDRHRDSYRLGISFTPTDWFDNYTMFQHNSVDENNTGTVLLDFNENNQTYNTTPFVGAGWVGIALPPGLIPQLPKGGLCYQINGTTPANIPSCISTRLGILDNLRNGLIAEENRVKNGGDSAKRKNVTGDILVYEGKTEQLNNITKIELGELGWLGETSIKNVLNTVRNLGVHTKYDSGSPIPNGLVFNNYDLVNFVPVANSKSDGRNDWFDDFSEEFQISGSIDGKHDWIMGYYYEEDNDELNYPPLFSAYGNAFSPTLSPSVVATFSKNSLNRDRGYFAQGTADLSDFVDGLKLTYGWRHSESNFDGFGLDPDALALSQGNLEPGTTGAPRPKVRSEANTHNVSLDYQVSPDMLLYVASRTGFKPGGANVAPPAGAVVPGYVQDYGPEKVEDVEFGMKADWDVAGRPLRTNLAVYRTWYNDIQRSQTLSLNGIPFTQTGNIAKARIDGLELTAMLQATDRLLLTLNYSYTDPEYLEWPGTTTAVLTGEVKQLIDSPYVGTPKNQGTLSARYTLPTPSEWGEIAATADLYAQSSVHLNDTELADGFGEQPGYSNLNLRLDWANVVGTPVDLAVFATNVTNGIHAQSLNSFYSVVGTANAVYSEPRMWGAEVRYRFGANK